MCRAKLEGVWTAIPLAHDLNPSSVLSAGGGKTRNGTDIKPPEGQRAVTSNPGLPTSAVHPVSPSCTMDTRKLTFAEHVLCACHFVTCLACPVSFDPANCPMSWNYYCPYFKDEETKAQRGNVFKITQ